MSTIFIFHGAHGHPQENWFPWLKSELEKHGYTVYVPRFPTPKHQSPEAWHEVFAPYQKDLNHNSILIGHSLGTAFALRVLENIDHSVRATFLIASISHETPQQFGVEPFLKNGFDIPKIQKNCQQFCIYHGDDDPYNSLQSAYDRAAEFDAQITVVKNGGHLNTAAGYTEFPQLLEHVLQI